MDVEATPWEPDEPYEVSIARIKAIAERAGKPGFNEYGVPLHACYGHIHNEHVWAYVREQNRQRQKGAN